MTIGMIDFYYRGNLKMFMSMLCFYSRSVSELKIDGILFSNFVTLLNEVHADGYMRCVSCLDISSVTDEMEECLKFVERQASRLKELHVTSACFISHETVT